MLVNLPWLEIIGTLFGLTQVLLARKNIVHNYLFGIVAILIGTWVYYQSKLYGDILLNVYYFIMSVYGWTYWKYGKNHKESKITYTTKKEFITACGIVIVAFSSIGYWLYFHTNTDVPLWDALLSAFAWAGMWLMAKRKIENWIFLNISNFIAIPLLFYKGLYVYMGLTVFLFIVAISGYIKWRNIIENERRIAGA